MRSIRNITIALSMAVFAISAEAQDKTLLQTEVIAKQLELTEKQKAVLDKQLKQAKADREVLVSRIKALQEEVKRDAFVKQQAHEAEMKALLTPEQFAKFQEMQKKKRIQKIRAKGQRGQGRFQNGQAGTLRQGQFRRPGQRGIQNGNARGQSRQFQQRGQGQARRFPMFEGSPEERQEMMKKFQEFLEEEKKKNGGGGK